MRGLLLALLVLGASLAGCTQAPPAADVDPASDQGPQGTATLPAPTPGTPGAKNGTGDAPKGNGTAPGKGGASPAPPPAKPPVSSAPRQWPALDAATVRPGVQTFYDGMQCTSNFVFTSPDNATVYLGSAAHCFGPQAKVGDAVDVGEGLASGVLAYSSWLVMGSDGGDPNTGDNPACSVEADQTLCDYNDFALIRVDEASEGVVHPAMLRFGGPTALAPSAEVQQGQKVLTYGNTWVRQGIDETNWHEGYVLEHAEPWTTTTYTASPGVPGDSGSGVLTGDGRAFGVLVTIGLYPLVASNGVTSLDLAMDYAREKAGVEVQLATWELLDSGLLPPV
jgi:hypothetical protein